MTAEEYVAWTKWKFNEYIEMSEDPEVYVQRILASQIINLKEKISELEQRLERIQK